MKQFGLALMLLLATACPLLSQTLAKSKIRNGVYRGLDQNQNACQIEVLDINEDDSELSEHILSVVVNPLPWRRVLNIAALAARESKSEDTPVNKTYAGYWGKSDKLEIIKLAMDKNKAPMHFEYFNTYDFRRGEGGIHMKCTNLSLIETEDEATSLE